MEKYKSCLDAEDLEKQAVRELLKCAKWPYEGDSLNYTVRPLGCGGGVFMHIYCNKTGKILHRALVSIEVNLDDWVEEV